MLDNLIEFIPSDLNDAFIFEDGFLLVWPDKAGLEIFVVGVIGIDFNPFLEQSHADFRLRISVGRILLFVEFHMEEGLTERVKWNL